MMMPKLLQRSGWAGVVAGGALLACTTGSSRAETTMEFPVAGGDGALQLQWLGDAELRAGEDYSYTLRVTNGADIPVQEVVLHQKLPQGFSLEKSQPQAQTPRRDGPPKPGIESQPGAEPGSGPAPARSDEKRLVTPPKKAEGEPAAKHRERDPSAAQEPRRRPQAPAERATWRMGTLNPGQSREVKITGMAEKEGTLEACAWVTFQPAFCQQLKVVKPDLKLTHQILDVDGRERDVFYHCEDVLVRYQLTNTGSGETAAATIRAQLPEGLRTAEGGREVVIRTEPLSAGETVTRTLRLDPQQPGEFTLRAEATTGSLQARAASRQLMLVEPELELQVQAPERLALGKSAQYRITLINRSEVPALDAFVMMPAPAENMRFTKNDREISEDVDGYRLGIIPPNSQKSFTLAFQPREIGKIETTVTARAYCADEMKKKIATEVHGVPAVQISVVDRQDPINTGDETVYEVKVTNEGSADDQNIRLQGRLPDHLEFVDARGDTEVDGSGQKLEFSPIKALKPGDTASWYITVKGAEKGRGQLKVTMTTDAVPQQVVSAEPTTVF